MSEESQVQDNQAAVTDQPEQPVVETPEQPKPGPAAGRLQTLLQEEAHKRESDVQKAEQTRLLSQAEQIVNLAKSDPLKFLEVTGADMSRLKPPKPKDDPLAALREELESVKGTLSERQQREAQLMQQAQLDQVRRSVHSFVDQSEDQFPLTRNTGMSDAVYDTLVAYHKSGQPISEVEAAREVENNLVRMIEKALENPTIRNRFLSSKTPSPSISTIDSGSPSLPSYESEDEYFNALASLIKELPQ